MKRFVSLILIFTLVFTASTFTKAASNEGTLLTKFIPISKPTLDFTLVKQFGGDKVVIHKSDNTYPLAPEYGLVNLKGEMLLDTKYDYIKILKNGNVQVYYESVGRVDTYDKHMIPISSKNGVSIPDEPFFENDNKIDENTTFSNEFYEPIIHIYNKLTGETKDLTLNENKYKNSYYLYAANRYRKEIKALDCVIGKEAYSGCVPYEHLSCFDLNGNDVFENDLGVNVLAYIGDGYYFYEKNDKNGVAILPGFKEKKVEKILKKPTATKIKKIWKKNKSSKKLKLSLQKVTNTNGYYIKVYSSKKNAKKDKRALLSKKTKKATITLKSKKLARKNVLYVKAKTYNNTGHSYYWGNWTKPKKVKIK